MYPYNVYVKTSQKYITGFHQKEHTFIWITNNNKILDIDINREQLYAGCRYLFALNGV